MPPGDNVVRLRAEFEGLEDVGRALDIIQQQVNASNSNMPGGGLGGGHNTVPAGSPPGTRPAPDPYQGAGDGAMDAGVLGGGGGGYGGWQPLHPTQHAGPAGSSGGSPTGGGGGGGGGMGAGGNTTINTPNVTIINPGGAGGGAPPSGNQPGSPLPGWNPFGGGGSGGFMQNFMQNPTPAGFVHSALNEIPQGAAYGMLAGGAYVAGLGLQSYVAGTQPRYDLQTRMESAAIAGRYVPPEVRAAMERQADMQGRLNALDVWSRPFESVPLLGGIATSFFDIAGRRDLRRGIEEAGAATERIELGRTQRSLGLNYTGSSTNAQIGTSAAAALSRFGTGAVNAAGNARFNAQLAHGASPGDITEALGVIGSIGDMAEHPEMANALGAGRNPLELATVALPVLISQGDTGKISALFRAGFITEAQQNDALGKALGARSLSVAGRQIQAGVGATSAALDLGRATGMGFAQRSELMQTAATQTAGMGVVLRQRLALATSDVERNELQTQIAQLDAQVAGQRLGARMEFYSGEQQIAGAASSVASTNTNIAMFTGTETDVRRGFAGQQSAARAQASILDSMANDPSISPEARAQYAAQAQAARFQAETGLSREVGNYSRGLRLGEIGVAGAQVNTQQTLAGLFGNSSDIYTASQAQIGIIGRQEGVTRGRLAGEYGPITAQERLDAQRELTDLIRQETQARVESTRNFYSLNLQIAQTGESIAGSQQARSNMMGIGGVAGFGAAQRSYETFQGATRAASAVVANLRAQGVKEDSPQMMAAVAAQESAMTQEVSSGIGRANVPISIGLQRQESSLNYTVQALSTVPFAYGNTRTALMGLMNNKEREAQEIRERMEAQRRANGGTLSEPEAFAYQQQLQQVGLSQAGIFQQLSTGWESRIISQGWGRPNSAMFIDPMMSMRSAVGAGVRNPAFGTTRGDLPEFLRQAAFFGSIAGAEGTSEGIGVTGMTNARAKSGFSLMGPMGGSPTVRLEGGVHMTISGTLDNGQAFSGTGVMEHTNRAGRTDTSPAALTEFIRTNGVTVPPSQR